MKYTIFFIAMLFLYSMSFGYDLSLEEVQGGSEEKITFMIYH